MNNANQWRAKPSLDHNTKTTHVASRVCKQILRGNLHALRSYSTHIQAAIQLILRSLQTPIRQNIISYELKPKEAAECHQTLSSWVGSGYKTKND